MFKCCSLAVRTTAPNVSIARRRIENDANGAKKSYREDRHYQTPQTHCGFDLHLFSGVRPAGNFNLWDDLRFSLRREWLACHRKHSHFRRTRDYVVCFSQTRFSNKMVSSNTATAINGRISRQQSRFAARRPLTVSGGYCCGHSREQARNQTSVSSASSRQSRW